MKPLASPRRESMELFWNYFDKVDFDICGHRDIEKRRNFKLKFKFLCFWPTLSNVRATVISGCWMVKKVYSVLSKIYMLLRSFFHQTLSRRNYSMNRFQIRIY